MKIILVLQSLIILAGAMYIFTLSQSEVSEVESVQADPLPPPPPPITPTPDVVTPAAPASDIAGPNDAGMEWPTIEAEGDLEVR